MVTDIWIDKNLLRSEAFRSLRKWSMLVYFDFLKKRQMHEIGKPGRKEWIIKNNGEIVYTYREAELKGISRTQFRNTIDELMEKGFLDINQHGSGGRKKDYTTYFIDDRWQYYGTEKFRPPKNPRVKDSRKGRGWASIMGNPGRKKALLNHTAYLPPVLNTGSFFVKTMHAIALRDGPLILGFCQKTDIKNYPMMRR